MQLMTGYWWNQWPLNCRLQSVSHSFFFLCLSVWYCLGQSLSLSFLFPLSNIISCSCFFFFFFNHLLFSVLSLPPFFCLTFSVSTSPCFSFFLLLIPFVWASLFLLGVFPLLSGGIKLFEVQPEERHAFSPNTLHPGYWHLQHGLLCATVIRELYWGNKYKPATTQSHS